MDLASFRALRTPAGERALAAVAARGVGPGAVLSTLTALRPGFEPGLLAAAVTQVRLRERAAAKFGSAAARMFFTPDGMEQATRSVVAGHHAARLLGPVPPAPDGPARVLDLCCGIGADLVAFALAAGTVRGVEVDPLTVEVARANAEVFGVRDRVSVECADATAVSTAGWSAAFVDPARRRDGRRVFDPRAYSPPLSFVADLAARVPRTGAKLAAGIPHEALPPGAEAEWVSVGGEVKEAALWFGPLATAARRATLLPGGHTLTDSGLGPPPVGRPGPWLYEPDGAVIRAGLVNEVAARLPGGRLVDSTIAYVAADGPAPLPFATGYQVTDVLPFSLARLRRLLRSRGVGQVTVKKRGSPIDPDHLRRQLRLSGSGRAVVVLTRVAGVPTVLLCAPRPVPAPS